MLNNLDTTSNPLSCIKVNNVTLAESEANWNKDDATVYSLDCDTFYTSNCYDSRY